VKIAVAVAFAVALILGAPVVGEVRTAVRSAFPADFTFIIGSMVAGTIGVAFLAACARARRRRLQFAILLAALALGAVFARLLSTGAPEVDVVERFHFVEYGLLTALFYRAWRDRADGSVFLLPFLAGFLVGTLDEWFQWFVPARVGEMRDVWLDAVASACGLLFAVGFAPPTRFTPFLGRGSRRRVCLLAATATLAFGIFFQAVHLGYQVGGPETGTFRSTFSTEELLSASRDRETKWRGQAPVVPGLVSREDHYLSEALWHVQRRNRAWTAQDIFVAWQENRILETFFAPALDAPSYLGRTGLRWPAAQRLDAEARSGRDHSPYVSDAEPYPLYTWPKSIFWTMVFAMVAWLVLKAREGSAGQLV
jgi:VanZ family protein